MPHSTASPSPRKLRILCLHGYHGNARVLRSQMGSLAAELEPLAELVFIDAPSLAAADYGWWHAVNDERDPASDDPGVGGRRRHYKGWARTREAIVALFESRGPFDGVFGFSQGAALAGLLVGLRAPDGRPTPERPLRFDFALVVSGFSSNDPELARLHAQRDSYDLPSLHVFGRADAIVAAADSRALSAHFTNPTLVEHAGGHVIPDEPFVRDRIRAFLEERRASSAAARDPSAAPRAPLDVSLWPHRSSPAMRVVFPPSPPTARTAALVIFRGGAYATSQGSGAGAAEWAAAHGMVGVEVAYRTAATGDRHPASYADGARAMRLVRDHAAAWNIDPARVGVLGFSAGGHLASLLSTQPTLHADPADDLAARLSARPDFVILGYPLISFVEGYAPGAFVNSVQSFFGQPDPAESDRRRYSSELHVTPDHPPVFLWTTADDALVPASHSQRFAEACQRAGVPVTFRLFPHGPHGMGLALDHRGDVGTWTSDALAWLADRAARR
ncbi:MAG TPA: alpha/beta hydrolase fold domain-containing protein [Kofleriaceae bacterium]|nr:alpha/beta hydrolase fold domain-containing protein [Kofleriaceae bacterium]